MFYYAQATSNEKNSKNRIVQDVEQWDAINKQYRNTSAMCNIKPAKSFSQGVNLYDVKLEKSWIS